MKISVVIPCYNAEACLNSAVASVVAQGVEECEIIIVDDASTDATAALAERFAQVVPNLRLIRLETNSGPAVARNAGLAEARGEYVCFLDADDAYGEGLFNRLLTDLAAVPWADGVTFGIRLVNAHREVLPQQLVMIQNSIPGNVVVRRDFARAIGGFPTAPEFRTKRAGEDCAFRLALKRWGTIGSTEHGHMLYTVHRDSHFDLFLDSMRVVGDRLEFGPADADAAAVDQAVQAHIRKVDLAMLAGIGNPRLVRIHGQISGRSFDFEVPDRPELIGKANSFLMQTEYPLLSFLGPVQTILDVGAESGASSVYFACTYPGARVIALEPTRRGFVLLRRNTLAHPRVEPFKIGLYNAPTRLEIAVPGLEEEREQVLTATPETLLRSIGINQLDIVRLDNRGAEVPAVLAMADRLRTAKAIFIRYYRDADRRVIDGVLAPSHTLYWGRSTRPNRGEFLYVQRTLLGPDGIS